MFSLRIFEQFFFSLSLHFCLFCFQRKKEEIHSSIDQNSEHFLLLIVVVLVRLYTRAR